jgi:dTDP-4-dehydrorhamnose reductase
VAADTKSKIQRRAAGRANQMKPVRIAVTGNEGQLVRSLRRRASETEGVEVIPVGRPWLDLQEPDSVAAPILAAKPDIVVNAAAYTAVDLAEDEPGLAYRINQSGAGAVAAAAATLGIPVIQISTDFVFQGDCDEAHIESDPTNPVSVYGASKLAGEIAVAEANSKHVIFRTAWVYSPFGKNFVKTIIRLARERDVISVVSDQYGNPTSALDLADGIIHVAKRVLTAASSPDFGIFHLAGSGQASWSDVAEEVMNLSRSLGGPHVPVRRIASAEYPAKARRPLNSRLDCSKLYASYSWRAPDWRHSLRGVVATLLEES